jgi:adenosylcobinamide-GDP ribazoletransferase
MARSLGKGSGGGFRAAISLLTVVPVGAKSEHEAAPSSAFAQAPAFFPLVGVIFGLLGVGVLGLAEVLGVDMRANAVLLGALVVGAWAGLSGFLHWDGVADTADGVAVRGAPDRRLAAMSDPRVGAVGAAAVALLALAEVGAVAALAGSGALWALVLAPVLGRAAASIAVWTLPAAREDGLAASVSGRPFPSEVAWLVAAVVGVIAWAAAAATWWASSGSALSVMGAAVAGLVAAYALPRTLARPFGGTTGDVLGATVVMVETTVLAVAAVAV